MDQPGNEFLQCRQKLHSRVHVVVCGLNSSGSSCSDTVLCKVNSIKFSLFFFLCNYHAYMRAFLIQTPHSPLHHLWCFQQPLGWLSQLDAGSGANREVHTWVNNLWGLCKVIWHPLRLNISSALGFKESLRLCFSKQLSCSNSLLTLKEILLSPIPLICG